MTLWNKFVIMSLGKKFRNECYSSYLECKSELQFSKERLKELRTHVETCNDVVDSFIRLGCSDKAKEALEVYNGYVKLEKECIKTINMYYALIIDYENGLLL